MSDVLLPLPVITGRCDVCGEPSFQGHGEAHGPRCTKRLTATIDDHFAPAINARPMVTWEPNLQGTLEPDGSVRVTAGRCRECRNWYPYPSTQSVGICEELSSDERKPVTIDAIDTEADFGCVLWVRKP